MAIPLPKFKKHKFKLGSKHWKIGKAGYPLSKIISDIQMVEFKIEKTYSIFEILKFLILRKNSIETKNANVK